MPLGSHPVYILSDLLRKDQNMTRSEVNPGKSSLLTKNWGVTGHERSDDDRIFSCGVTSVPRARFWAGPPGGETRGWDFWLFMGTVFTSYHSRDRLTDIGVGWLRLKCCRDGIYWDHYQILSISVPTLQCVINITDYMFKWGITLWNKSKTFEKFVL